MKKSIFLGLILINLIGLDCMNKTKPNYLLENQLQQILNEKEYFKLKELLDGASDKIRPEKKAYFSAFVASAFNHTDESITTIEQLIKKDSSSMNDSAKVALLLLQRNNYFKVFQYKKAASIGKELLEKYRATIGIQLHDIQNTLIIHEGLSNILPQKIHIQSDTLPWKRDKLGLIEIPFRTKNKNYNIVFDTRAYISTVTKSFAKQIGLRMLPFSYEESSGITGKTFKSEMGIADSLYIGNILVENVVFQVLDDELLNFPTADFQMEGILGFPVITALKQVQISKEGHFTISASGINKQTSNMAFDGSTTIISAKTNGDTLSYHFDTGATGTELYSNYFNKYRAKIKKDGIVQDVESGGAGGTVKRQVYILPHLELFIGNKKASLKEVTVQTIPPFNGQKYNGNIGQDVINQFDEMVLNFEYMNIEFR